MSTVILVIWRLFSLEDDSIDLEPDLNGLYICRMWMGLGYVGWCCEVDFDCCVYKVGGWWY